MVIPVIFNFTYSIRVVARDNCNNKGTTYLNNSECLHIISVMYSKLYKNHSNNIRMNFFQNKNSNRNKSLLIKLDRIIVNYVHFTSRTSFRI